LKRFAINIYTNWRRLARLERTVSALVKRLEEGSTLVRPTVAPAASSVPVPLNDASSGTHSSAPVLLIRDVAYEVGMRQQAAPVSRAHSLTLDIIDRRLITMQEAFDMIALFVSILL
jgi:hypothetical protein